MREEKKYKLAVIAECVLNKKLLIKANNLEEAKLKAKKHLDNYLNTFSMFEVHVAVKDREVKEMALKFMDCEAKDFCETANSDQLIFTHLDVPYE